MSEDKEKEVENFFKCMQISMDNLDVISEYYSEKLKKIAYEYINVSQGFLDIVNRCQAVDNIIEQLKNGIANMKIYNNLSKEEKNKLNTILMVSKNNE